MIILGIETSCDETAISIVEACGTLKGLNFKVLGSTVHSQIDVHKEYGGVFPMLAKREHQKNLPAVLIETLRKADFGNELLGMNYESWGKRNPSEKFPIDMIAVTVGPGLEPALWTGIEFAKKLGEKWNVSVIGANHMLGHIVSVLFSENSKLSSLNFPAVALLISGGHTELVLLKNWIEIKKLGETQDDAVGEAFDKVARMLGLSYPGGPAISALAETARQARNVRSDVKFPRPMIHSKDFNFSFSGLKTAVLYYLRDNPGASKLAVAREFEDAVIETLLHKTKKAIDKYSPETLVVGGGVIANKALRENFLKLKEIYSGMEISIPEKSLSTDNATMIAAAGFIEYLGRRPARELRAQGNLDI